MVALKEQVQTFYETRLEIFHLKCIVYYDDSALSCKLLVIVDVLILDIIMTVQLIQDNIMVFVERSSQQGQSPLEDSILKKIGGGMHRGTNIRKGKRQTLGL